MKKTIVMALCFIGAAATASAQFKIHSNGKMSFMRTGTSQPSSPVSLVNGSDSRYFVAYSGDWNGVYSHVGGGAPAISNKNYSGYFHCDNSNVETNVGLMGMGGISLVQTLNNNPGSVGLWGECNCYTVDRYGYGVLGKGFGIYNTAAVCGIASGSSVSSAIPDDKYAGLFVGKTKVIGSFVSGTNTNDVSLINASLSFPDSGELLTGRDGQVSEAIMALNARSFRYNPAVKPSGPEPTFLDKSEEEKAELAKKGVDVSKLDEPEEDVIARQIYEKQHYGFSVDELEKVFPDLVYEDKDGSKKINYVEMVPLLVQCINELNVRLSAVDGGKVGAEPVLTRKAGTIETAIDGTTAKTQAVLYQNSPNPFTAQTEIRFSLPDDAPQAYIYIFDMTGKMQKQIPVGPSQQSITINGYELQAGIYLYSLVVGGQEIDTKRMILSK